MSRTRTVRDGGLRLLGWDHTECQERTLRVPWWAARAVMQAIREAL